MIKVIVSTHSRLKAATQPCWVIYQIHQGFNTQPPEGGCGFYCVDDFTCFSFNTQPPEGGCQHAADKVNSPVLFQHTATRRWLPHHTFVSIAILNCFNTQPPEGGCIRKRQSPPHYLQFQHTATRRWLPANKAYIPQVRMFQHTATRRWLRSFSWRYESSFGFQHTATRRWLRQNLVLQE